MDLPLTASEGALQTLAKTQIAYTVQPLNVYNVDLDILSITSEDALPTYHHAKTLIAYTAMPMNACYVEMDTDLTSGEDVLWLEDLFQSRTS